MVWVSNQRRARTHMEINPRAHTAPQQLIHTHANHRSPWSTHVRAMYNVHSTMYIAKTYTKQRTIYTFVYTAQKKHIHSVTPGVQVTWMNTLYILNWQCTVNSGSFNVSLFYECVYYNSSPARVLERPGGVIGQPRALDGSQESKTVDCNGRGGVGGVRADVAG
jgi:hypothetical protein